MNLNHLFLSSQVGPLKINDGFLVLGRLSRKMLHMHWCARLYTKCLCIFGLFLHSTSTLGPPCFTPLLTFENYIIHA